MNVLQVILLTIIFICFYYGFIEAKKMYLQSRKLKKEVEKEKSEPKIFRSVYPFDKEEWDRYVQDTRI